MENSTQISTTGNAENDGVNTRIISIVVVLCVLALVCVIGFLLYRKICKSHHSKHKHGVAGNEMGGRRKGKVEYYDQFGCDTNELTINSVTAITWEDDDGNRKRKRVVEATGSSSGVDCDSSSDDAKDSKINTGKRVFQVHKVSEKPSRKQPGQVVIRLNKGFTDAARSLQASDGRNYSLALIDENSLTVHNIDLNRKKSPKARSPLIGETERHPQSMSSGRLRPLDSSGDSAGQAACSSTNEMVHDSPDLARRGKVSKSVDEIMCGSVDSVDKVKAEQYSLSSEEVDCLDSTNKLLPVVADVSS